MPGLAVDHLDGRRPAELAAAEDQRLLEQPALLEVGQECRDRLVAVLGQLAVVLRDVVVAVPGLDVAVIELDEPHAPLDQAAGDQELPGLHARPVGVADIPRLLLDVEGVGGGHLHAIRQLEAGDPRIEGVVLGTRLEVPAVQLGQEVELPALVGSGHGRVLDILDQVLDPAAPGVDVGPLVDAGQERRAPVGDVGDRQTGTHRDEAGQVLVFGAQAVGESRPPCSAATAARRRSSSAASTARGWACWPASSGSRRCRRCARAVRAKISLTSIPLWPYFWNRNGDGSAVPVFRSVVRFPCGSILPSYFFKSGLGSNVSTCDGPPFK